MILSFDVGSTYCKGALFTPGRERLRLIARGCVPTSPQHLPDGVYRLLEELKLSPEALAELEVFWSSSAKGGLGIVALGIVPELTLKMAREAACSAGGKIVKVFNYKLNADDLKQINLLAPDILLFTGGTDGGNEDIVLHNARLLGNLNRDIPVIYAGNRAVRPQIRELFAAHELYIVENVLPDMDNPDPVPAQNRIREIFLDRIVAGKGLDEIVSLTGSNPLPTPYAMLEFIRTVRASGKMGDFGVIDLGGATTDFYSACRTEPGAGVIVRGFCEPEVKRSVEGDIGMRVSAGSAFEAAYSRIVRRLERQRLQVADFAAYVGKVTANPAATEKLFDRILAGACVSVAAERHAGRNRRVYTVNGGVEVRSGKDLRSIQTVIGSGGYLAGCDAAFMRQAFAGATPRHENEICLLPRSPVFRFDRGYLLPLLANAAGKYPEAACGTLSEILSGES
ncbi:MAG: glutamate mutase L [Victivallaceae bacterium]|nr:glutamate mutase L [Victivallaceae bacterium]